MGAAVEGHDGLFDGLADQRRVGMGVPDTGPVDHDNIGGPRRGADPFGGPLHRVCLVTGCHLGAHRLVGGHALGDHEREPLGVSVQDASRDLRIQADTQQHGHDEDREHVAGDHGGHRPGQSHDLSLPDPPSLPH